jgi:hypothetical protein
MDTASIAVILLRDIRALRRELEAYPDERQLWAEPAGITNSGGTLALHLVGNLRHFIGARLGGTGYLRDRPAEFARRHVPRAELLAEIAGLEGEVTRALAGLDSARLEDTFPEEIAGLRLPTGQYLVHLVAHFTFHLGQLDYHRRVVTGQPTGVGAVRPAELTPVATH